MSEIADRYLRALDAGSAFSFHLGKLALTDRSAVTAGILLFAPVP